MQGAEKLPTESPSAANNDASASARRSPSHTIRGNVHTNVLGMDAGDSARDVGFGNTAENNNTGGGNSSTAAASNNETKSGWWGSGIFGGNGNEDSDNKNDAENHMNRKRRSNNARYDGLQQSLEEGQYDPPPLSGVTVASSSSVATEVTPSEATAATREDRVREDCSYFYRGMEENSSPYHRTRSSRKGGRTVTAANSMLRRLSVRARLSGEVDGALFMSRYERLNQVIDPTKQRRSSTFRHRRGQQYTGNDNISSNEETNNHELFLEEENGETQSSSYREHIPSPTNNVVMGATSLANPHGVRSSMFFEQDGKMLMRLPRDQVRLVMDYNLEPGILSVEQWRSQEDAQEASEKLAAQNSLSKQTVQRERERDRRHRRRERERRRRRRRKRRRERKQQQKTSEAEQTGQEREGKPLETVPLEEGKVRDVEESKNEDDHNDDSDSDSSYSDDDDDDSYWDDDDSLDQNLLPELKYVITIPDDLYRRMVAEMSAKAFPPYWGFLKCCHQESERADIKLALVILAVVMSLLFVGSLEWRTT